VGRAGKRRTRCSRSSEVSRRWKRGIELRPGADAFCFMFFPSEPFSEADARLQVLKLREYLNTGSDAQLATDFAVSQGASMYEQIRDGLVSSEEKGSYNPSFINRISLD
jgi:hypothetical protein